MSKLAINGGTPVRTQPWPIFYPPYTECIEKEIEAANRVLRSRQLCAQFGKEVEAFENDFAQYIGVKHAIAVSNGTTALHVALMALGVEMGDEVIVPAYTFLATASSVLMQNAVAVFADSDPDLQGMDLEHVKKLATSRTKAMIPVHPNGFPLDMDPLMEFANRNGIGVIEDCSHAHGAEYKGRKIGSIGHINIFSFQQKKNLPLGEGGMITTNDDQLARKARGARSFGPDVIGYNYRMPELHGAIGKVRLAELDHQNAIRIENANHLYKKLVGIPGLVVQKPLPNTKCVYYNFMIRVDPEVLGISRAVFLKALNAEGIIAGSLYFPCYRDQSFRKNHVSFYKGPESERPNYADGACPVAEDYCDNRNVEIKVHAPTTTKDMDDAAAAIKKIIDNIEEIRKSRPCVMSA